MNAHDGSQLSRATAEHLLDGGAAGSGHLHALLRAAAAPATEAELAGQARALQAFRAAHLATPKAPWRPRMMKTTIAQMLAAKFATTAAVAAAASGGIALAAATGTLPTPGHHSSHVVASASASASPSATDAADAVETAAADVTESGTDTATTTATESADPAATATGAAEPGKTPSPNLEGLCRAYQAGATAHGKSIDSAAFTVLVTAAGGKDNLESFCITLIGAPRSHPAGAPTARPSQAVGAPAARPSVVPSRKAAGKPGAVAPSSAVTEPSGSAPQSAPTVPSTSAAAPQPAPATTSAAPGKGSAQSARR